MALRDPTRPTCSGRTTTTPIVTALAVALVGCAHLPWAEAPFRCPARGGPAWVEVRTDHFVLSGDVTPGEGRALVLELEELRGALLEGLFHPQPPEVDALVRVVVFRRLVDFGEFAPPSVHAYLSQNGLGEHVIVMPFEPASERRTPPEVRPQPRDGERERPSAWFRADRHPAPSPARVIVVHELTHLVLRQAFPRQPRWFGEGYAGLAETLAEEREAFGRLPVAVLRGFEERHVTARELLAWKGRAEDLRHHDSAAMLVHFLLHEEPGRFDDFRRRLSGAERPDAAWAAVFPEWAPAAQAGPEALDLRLAAHARRPWAVEWPARRAGRATPALRQLAASDVHAIRLTLPRFERGSGAARERERERAEVEEALAEDPDQVVALQVKATLEGLDPLPLAERAVAAHPEDVRARLWLAASLPRDGSGGMAADARRIAELRRAVELAPRSAMAANNLAWNLLLQGHRQEALPLAERAAQLSAGDPMILDTLAAALEAVGRCPEALRTAERALDFLPEQAQEGALAPWTERADRLRAACGPAGPDASSATR